MKVEAERKQHQNNQSNENDPYPENRKRASKGVINGIGNFSDEENRK